MRSLHSMSAMPDVRARPPRRSGAHTSPSEPGSEPSSPLPLRRGSRADKLAPAEKLKEHERGNSEAGATPARPRHCNGYLAIIGQALHSVRHWETGKASGVPKPGDLSVRATMKPSGEGWWRCPVVQPPLTAHSSDKGWAELFTRPRRSNAASGHC